MNKYSYVDNIFCRELGTNIKGFFPAEKMKILTENATEGVVFKGTEYRPDKLAFYYLGDESLGWVISLTNYFIHGIEDYWLGRKILIPTKESILKIGDV